MKDTTLIVNDYLVGVTEVLGKMSLSHIVNILRILHNKIVMEQTIYVVGNGGSSATASHLVCDLMKSTNRKDFKVVCLSDNIPIITAIGNDKGYEYIFSDQLKNLGQQGDLLLAITGSGNSKNIIEVIKMAKSLKMSTMAFLGFDGGKVKSIVDSHILVPAHDYGPIEDTHMVLVHLITEYFKLKLPTVTVPLNKEMTFGEVLDNLGYVGK